MHLDDGRGNVEHILRRHKSESLGEGWKRFGGAWRHAHAAAGEYVVAKNLSIFMHDKKAEIVGVHIDTIILWECKSRLEFARQIGQPVDRFDFLLD